MLAFAQPAETEESRGWLFVGRRENAAEMRGFGVAVGNSVRKLHLGLRTAWLSGYCGNRVRLSEC